MLQILTRLRGVRDDWLSSTLGLAREDLASDGVRG